MTQLPNERNLRILIAILSWLSCFELHPRLRAGGGPLLWHWSASGALTAPVVLTNGHVIVGVNRRGSLDQPPDLGRIFAVEPGGTEAWSQPYATLGLANPTVGPDGRIWVTVNRGGTNLLLALDAEGAVLLETPATAASGTLSVGNDGTVVCLGRSRFLTPQFEVYSPDGVLSWTSNLSSVAGGAPGQYSLQADGTVLVNTVVLTAYEPHGQLRWRLASEGAQWSAPALASDDRVVVLNSLNDLMALQMDGTPLWTNRLAIGRGSPTGPVVDAEGHIFVTDSRSVLHALDAAGNELWQRPLPEPTPYPPLLDRDGHLLVAASGGIMILRKTGEPLEPIILSGQPTQPPVLTEDGQLLVVIASELFAYQAPSGLDTAAPWPMGRHDPRGTSSRPGPVLPPPSPVVATPIAHANRVRFEIEPEGRPAACELWRGDDTGFAGAVRIAEFPIGVRSLVDATAEPGRTYQYWIRARNSGGLSPFTGPVEGRSVSIPRRWQFSPAGYRPPAVAPDGTIYASGPSELTALRPDGSVLWSLPEIFGQPVVAADGTVVIRGPGMLYSISPLGTTNWVVENGASVFSTPAVDVEGRILTPGAGENFVVYSPDGRVQWQSVVGEFASSSPSIAADGVVALPTLDLGLMLWRPDGSELPGTPLEFNVESFLAPPWTSQGELLLPGDGLQAIRRDGTVSWQVNSLQSIESDPAVAADGSVFVRLNRMETPQSLPGHWICALDPDGTIRWQQPTDTLAGTPVLTAGGLVLVNGLDSIRALRATDGEPVWILETTHAASVRSLVLDLDGTLLVTSGDVLEAYDLGEGPADAPWPMHRQNPRQSASAQRPVGAVTLAVDSVGAAEVTLSVVAPPPTAILMTSTDLRRWRRLATLAIGGGGASHSVIVGDEEAGFYRVVLP